MKKQVLFLLSVVILSTLVSCEKNSSDDETLKLYGTWRQVSRAIDDVPAALDSTRLIIQIKSNNICVLYDSSSSAISSEEVVTRSGWSYSSGLFNIAADLPVSWQVDASNSGLGMERIDFNQDGTIIRTTLLYDKIANIEQE